MNSQKVLIPILNDIRQFIALVNDLPRKKLSALPEFFLKKQSERIFFQNTVVPSF